MLPYESYPSPSSSSSSPLSYSVRFENYFRSMVSGVERETPLSLSFLPSEDLFKISLYSMVYLSLLSSADFSKTLYPPFIVLVLSLIYLNICRLLRKLTLIYGVLILPLILILCQIFALHFGALVPPLF